MIDPKELRIGDYVYDAVFNEIKVVGLIYNSHDYDPIPINKKVLKACGFYQVDHGFKKFFRLRVSELLTIDAYNNKRTYYGTIKTDSSYFTYPIDFTSLHILQNLVFALTGKEITVDTKKLKTSIPQLQCK